MIELRDYQEDMAEKAIDILDRSGFVYIAAEVRTGKTLTSLAICEKANANRVVFLTKKRAISSITDDSDKLCPSYEFWCINYESMHKLPDFSKMGGVDVLVLDEAHGLGKFAKPSKRAKDVKAFISKYRCKVILLSGTPTPESYSQMYHQVYGIPNNPFSRYKDFYRFADDHVNKKQRMINGRMINDYSDGKDTILSLMAPYTVSYSQKQAGFSSEISEHVLKVRMDDETYTLANRLKRDLVVEGKDEVILADTPVKLLMKLHQIYSGTIKFESGNSMVIDKSKAEFIKQHFKGQKIGVFYKFKAELKALKSVFGSDLCEDLDTFNNTDCQAIALQIVSGREGISLRNAESLVYYNIDFSATSYWQSRDRMTTKERLKNDVYWIFSTEGIEREIYKTVQKKRDFTTRHFKKTL
jgi:hypothetical protein